MLVGVWRSGISFNIAALRRARLALGWMTSSGLQIPGQLSLAISPLVGANEYWRWSLGHYQGRLLAQLWQRYRARLASFSRIVQLYSQNHKIALLSHLMGHQDQYECFRLYLKVLTQINFAAQFYQVNVILLVKQRSSVSEPPFGELRGKLCDSSLDQWKARSQLLIGNNWTFSLALIAEAFENTSKSGSVEGVGHFEAKY